VRASGERGGALAGDERHDLAALELDRAPLDRGAAAGLVDVVVVDPRTLGPRLKAPPLASHERGERVQLGLVVCEQVTPAPAVTLPDRDVDVDGHRAASCILTAPVGGALCSPAPRHESHFRHTPRG